MSTIEIPWCYTILTSFYLNLLPFILKEERIKERKKERKMLYLVSLCLLKDVPKYIFLHNLRKIKVEE